MKPGLIDRWAAALVALILAAHAGVAVWSAASKSVTADEILYVTGGFFMDRYGDYRVQPENGVLPQRLHGLAAIWTHAPVPALEENEYWRTSSNLVTGHQFFYETGHDHFPMLMGARALNTLFSVGAGWLVFWWARRLAGPGAGLLATILYALDPNILAHAALATSDMAAVFFLTASVTTFWWQLDQPTFRRILGSAALFGLACVAKYSAVLLIPLFVGLLALHAWHSTAGRSWKLMVKVTALHAAGAIATIWLFYGFRFSGFSPELPPADHYSAPWNAVLPYIGWQGGVVKLCLDWKLLPEAFLYGYAWVIQSSQARAAFLAGDYGIYGWVSFFPMTFAWKTTESLLLALAAATVALGRRWITRSENIRKDVLTAAPLMVFVALYTAFSLTSKLNIGHRHLLPVYPALYAVVGGWAGSLMLRGWRVGVAATLIGLQLAANLSIAPHYLAYFNRLAGGPANGYRLLVDSSLDWGQDLPSLRDWLRQHNVGAASQPVFLSYFGSGEPSYYGISATHLPFINGFKFPQVPYRPQPGVYCISATTLQQVYSGINGEWTAAKEREYRELRQLEPALLDYMTEPSAHAELLKLAPAERWESGWRRYDKLRFARLCEYLRRREPDGNAGYSILIYRVSAADLRLALDSDLPTFLRVLGQAPASGN